MIIETERLILREMRLDDFDKLKEVFSDEVTMKYYPMPFSDDMILNWINWCKSSYEKNGYGLWTMKIKENNDIIGDCGLINQKVDGKKEVEIGYHVRKDMWCKGYATEAANRCREYAFDELKLTKVISIIRPENIPSRKIAEKLEMKIEKETNRKGILHFIYSTNNTA